MKKSFTLIELLVVIGIVVLLTAGIVAGLSSGKQKREVKTTAEKLKYVVTEAVSQAKTPDDNLFGLEKIEIRIYPYDSNITDLRNQVHVYNVLGTTSSENTKLSFKAPKGVYLDAEHPPTNGNMLFDTKCPNYNKPKPASGKDYYCFSIFATGSQIGQLTDCTSDNANNAVFMKVLDAAMKEGYSVKAYINNGIVINEQI